MGQESLAIKISNCSVSKSEYQNPINTERIKLIQGFIGRRKPRVCSEVLNDSNTKAALPILLKIFEICRILINLFQIIKSVCYLPNKHWNLRQCWRKVVYSVWDRWLNCLFFRSCVSAGNIFLKQALLVDIILHSCLILFVWLVFCLFCLLFIFCFGFLLLFFLLFLFSLAVNSILTLRKYFTARGFEGWVAGGGRI